MTLLAVALACLALFLFVWSYAIYPPLIRILASRRESPPGPPEPSAIPSVEVVLAAADEEGVIGARIANLLAQRPAGVYRVSVGCDGCRDRTAERARAAGEGAPVRVAEFPARRGKAAVVNDLVRESSGEILVFTDANTRFESDAVGRLTRAFADPAVGAVCGRLILERGAIGRETPESEFWDRETETKAAEGRLGICLGANGAIYAARRDLVEPLREDTTSMDDFLIPVRLARAGKKVIFAGDAVAREDAARDVAAEVSRRFRIGIGGGQVLRRELWLLDFEKHPTLTLAYLSRKAARWLAPLTALAAAVVALSGPRLRLVGGGALVFAGALLVVARLRPRLGGIVGRLYYFGVLNVALALGVAAGLSGYSRAAWERTDRT